MSIGRQATFWGIALIVLLLLIWLFSGILLPFIMGMALAYILDPVADRLERGGMNRFWATITILLITILVLLIVILVLIPVLASQFTAFLDRLPSYVGSLQALADEFYQSRIADFLGAQEARANLDQVVAQGAAWVGTVVTSIWAGGKALVNIVSLIFVTPVVAFYLLYDWDRMLARLDNLMPRDHVATIRALAVEINEAMAGFVRGQGAVCLILGSFYAVALSAIGLNFGFLIGSVAGLIGFIPYVGSVVGFVVAVGVALVQFWPDWPWIVAVAAIFVAGQFFEGNILQPRLVGQSVGIHPVWLMFALFAFGTLFGFVGLLLAVPATAAIGVLVRFTIARYQESRIYWGNERLPDRTPPDPLP